MSKLSVTIEGRTFEIEVTMTPQNATQCEVIIDGQTFHVNIPDIDKPVNEMEWLIIDDRPYEIVFDDDLDWIKGYGGTHPLSVRDLEAKVVRPSSADGRVKAPIPGMITRVLVETGAEVKTGQPVIVLEAMKMENEIRAPRDGVFTTILVEPGQTVVRNEVLAEIT